MKLGAESEAKGLEHVAQEFGPTYMVPKEMSMSQRVLSTKKILSESSDFSSIYQGVLSIKLTEQLSFEAIPDYLIRASGGEREWIVADSKLSKTKKIEAVLQLCDAAYLLSSTLEVELGKYGLLYLGQGQEPECIQLVSYYDYFFALRAEFEQWLRDQIAIGDLPISTQYPPVRCASCDSCALAKECHESWVENKDLSLVLGMTRRSRARLMESEVTNYRSLADAMTPPPKLSQTQFNKLRRQASYMVKSQLKGGDYPYCAVVLKYSPQSQFYGNDPIEIEVIDPSLPSLDLKFRGGKDWEISRQEILSEGITTLPPPSEWDVFFDIEGYPSYSDRGIEYLFGVATNTEEFNSSWESWLRNSSELEESPSRGLGYYFLVSNTYEEERSALIELVRTLREHVTRHPDAHIYHYGEYEKAALKRLSMTYGEGSADLGFLLSGGYFIDLLTMVRKGLGVGMESMSLKYIERFYDWDRSDQDVAAALSSMEMYATYLETQDYLYLEKIILYNKSDCLSTAHLAEWLHQLRELLPIEDVPNLHLDDNSVEVEISLKSDDLGERIFNLRQSLLELAQRLMLGDKDQLDGENSNGKGNNVGFEVRGIEVRGIEVMAESLGYYRRERSSRSWNFYHFVEGEASEEELEGETSILAALKNGVRTTTSLDGKQRYRFTFDPYQPTKLKTGSKCFDLQYRPSQGDSPPSASKSRSWQIVEFDQQNAIVEIEGDHHLEAGDLLHLDLMESDFISYKSLEESLLALGQELLALGPLHFRELRASGKLLFKESPLYHFRAEDSQEPLAQAIEYALNLKNSYLAIQGPPGTGKTSLGADLISALVGMGKRVGVTANSHEVISNLLGAVEKKGKIGVGAILQVGSTPFGSRGDKRPWEVEKDGKRAVRKVTTNHAIEIVGGTAWFFVRAELEGVFDYLVIDEASQLPLATVVAASRAAKNLILLGDPRQLSQPSSAIHPGESGMSALEYALDGQLTIERDKGIFLAKSHRLRPEICEVVSDLFYEGRLGAHPETTKARLVDLSYPEFTYGSHLVLVDHKGNSSQSLEEALVAKEIVTLLGGTKFHSRSGEIHDLISQELLFVAPYNAQVNMVRRKLSELGEGFSVGTVDKFQGQEAAVAILSMTNSDEEISSEALRFLLSKNRLNVGISRAVCASVLICSDALFDLRTTSLIDAELLSCLWRYRRLAVCHRAEIRDGKVSISPLSRVKGRELSKDEA